MSTLIPLPDNIIAKLKTILKDVDEYRRILSCIGLEAQSILDLFQMLLDTPPGASDSQFRRHLIVAMRRLSQKTDLYPRHFDLKGIRLLEDHPVAAGSFADIYKGQFQNDRVCIKVIRAYQSSLIECMAKLFAREAILWGQLSHPNILPFYGLYRHRSQLSFVSPWADNGHISDFLKQNPDEDRMLLCCDTAAGVAYLHENDIIHGDLKAMNVLVDSSGRACLADFGLSAVTDPDILQWASYSSAASKGGTIRWQAPELHEPESDDSSTEMTIHNTKASDIYAWACVAYEIFTGRIPFFECIRDATVIAKVSRRERPSRPSNSSPSWLEWGLTDSIWGVMEDCWNYEPRERPDISAIVSRLNVEKPIDRRPDGRWVGSAMRFRIATDANRRFPSAAVSFIFSSNNDGYPREKAAKARTTPSELVAPLQVSIDRSKETIYISPDSPEIVDRKVKDLLEELTMEKFDSISDQIIAWANRSEGEKDGRTLIQVIRLVFEKATDETTWSEVCARLCRKMVEQISPQIQDSTIVNAQGKPIVGGQLFRKYLLNRCQEDFERGWITKKTTAAAAAAKALEDQVVQAVNNINSNKGSIETVRYSDEYYAAQKAKRQGLGLIKFIGELFKFQMLTERIMHECIKKLLGNIGDPEEEDIESLCVLLSTIGPILDTVKARMHMDVYFSRMKELKKNKNVSSRMQFMLQDVINLREQGWGFPSARVTSTAIAQTHNNAVKGKVGQEQEARQHQVSISRGGAQQSAMSRRGGEKSKLKSNRDRSNFAQVGSDDWAVTGNRPSRPPPKAGDLSNFGRITKGPAITFGPGNIFAGKEGKLERKSSSSNMFSMLSQYADPAADVAKAPKVHVQRKRLTLLPRSVPTERQENNVLNSELKTEEDEIVPDMNEEQAIRKITEDVKELFAVRDLDEAEVYFTTLPAAYHPRFVDRLTSVAVESKEADAQLVARFFSRAVTRGLCQSEAFFRGLLPISVIIDDIAIDAPNAPSFFAMIVKAAGLNEEQRTRLASRAMDDDRKSGRDQSGFAQIDLGGRAVTGNEPPWPPPWGAELSNLGKITENTAITFGPSRVFTKGGKRERKSSTSNTFSVLGQYTNPAADVAKVSEVPVQRKRLTLLPRLKPIEKQEDIIALDAGSEIKEDEIVPDMNEEQAMRKITEDMKELFAVQDLDEAEVYFTTLPAVYHPRLVDRLTSVAVESKEADAQLVARFFSRVAAMGLCQSEAFFRGLLPTSVIVSDIAIDAPNAPSFFAAIVKAAGLNEEQRAQLASKAIDSDKLLVLLS